MGKSIKDQVEAAMGGIETEQRATEEGQQRKAAPLICDQWESNGAEAEWMRQEASEFAQEILAASTQRWLSLLGRSGTGKTMLAQSVRQKVNAGRNCQFWKWTSIINLLRSGSYDLKDQLARACVLIVDDLFAGQSSDFTQAYADELADSRLGKWTLFTSNETLEQIGERNPRVRSRMQRAGGRVVEILRTPDFCA